MKFKPLFSLPSFFSSLSVLIAGFSLFYDNGKPILSLSIYSVYFLVIFLGTMVITLKKKDFFESLLILLILLFQFLFFYSHFTSFSAEVRIGIEEPSFQYEKLKKGFLSKKPDLSIYFKSLNGDTAEIYLDEKKFEIKEGEELKIKDFKIKLKEINFAPEIFLHNNDIDIADCLIKVSSKQIDPPIVLDVLPHFFYIKNLDKDKIELKIIRGKIKVFDKVLKSGDPIEFDGIEGGFVTGKPFIILDVKKDNKPLFMVLTLISALIIIVRRAKVGA